MEELLQPNPRFLLSVSDYENLRLFWKQFTEVQKSHVRVSVSDGSWDHLLDDLRRLDRYYNHAGLVENGEQPHKVLYILLWRRQRVLFAELIASMQRICSFYPFAIESENGFADLVSKFKYICNQLHYEDIVGLFERIDGQGEKNFSYSDRRILSKWTQELFRFYADEVISCPKFISLLKSNVTVALASKKFLRDLSSKNAWAAAQKIREKTRESILKEQIDLDFLNYRVPMPFLAREKLFRRLVCAAKLIELTENSRKNLLDHICDALADDAYWI